VAPGIAFTAYGPVQGVALFGLGTSVQRTDPTGINTFPLGQAPTLTEGADWFSLPGADVAVFSGVSTGFGREPWRSNGLPNGTSRLLDVNPGSASSAPREFTHAGGLVYFTADDGTTGRELWAMATFPAVFAYGQGCPGTGGLVPQIAADDAPRLGATIDFKLSSALPNAIAVLALGLTGFEIPIGGGCSALNDALVVTGVLTGPAGAVQLPLPLPASPAVVGLSVFAQYGVLDPNGAFAATLALTGGLQALVGF
jgi:ELWxxDGT repeat protein